MVRGLFDVCYSPWMLIDLISCVSIKDYSIYKGLLVRQKDADDPADVRSEQAWQQSLEDLEGVKGVEREQEVRVA